MKAERRRVRAKVKAHQKVNKNNIERQKDRQLYSKFRDMLMKI